MSRPIAALLVLFTAAALRAARAAPAPDRSAADRPAPTRPSQLFRDDLPPQDPADSPPTPRQPPAQTPPANPAGTPRTPPRPDLTSPVPAPARTAEPSRRRHPIPDPAARAQSLQLLRELFADEYRAAESSPAAAKELTNELLRQAQQMRHRATPDDVTSRYALLTEVISLAASDHDFATALGAARDLADHYDVDGPALKLDLVARASREPVDPPRIASLVRAIFDVSDDAVSAGDLPGAASVLSQADTLARKSKDVALATEAQRRRKDLRELQAQYRSLAAALETLRQTPDDPAPNLTVGRFRCLVAGDFSAGLPLLAKSADANLRALAARDLRGAATPDAQAELADAWWALAEQNVGRVQTNLRSRSAYWYRQALSGLGGLKRTLAMKRLAASPAPPPGVFPPARSAPGPVVITGRPPVVTPRDGAPNDDPAQAPDAPPGPAQPGDRLLHTLATKFPPDARPVPGVQWMPAKSEQWLKTNLRLGTQLTTAVELQHCSTLQRHPATKKPHVYVTFRVPNPVEHDGIKHNLDISVRLEDQKALDAVTLAQGQRGQLSGTVTDIRVGGWSANNDRGLHALTFALMLDNIRFTPDPE